MLITIILLLHDAINARLTIKEHLACHVSRAGHMPGSRATSASIMSLADLHTPKTPRDAGYGQSAMVTILFHRYDVQCVSTIAILSRGVMISSACRWLSDNRPSRKVHTVNQARRPCEPARKSARLAANLRSAASTERLRTGGGFCRFKPFENGNGPAWKRGRLHERRSFGAGMRPVDHSGCMYR